MQRSPYHIIALILKVAAIMVGTYGVVLGFLIAVLGQSIECNEPPVWARLLYTAILLEGLAYCMPNGAIKRNQKVISGYLAFTSLPIFATMAFVVWAALTGGISEFWVETQIAAGSLFAFLLAPLSLIFSLLGDRETEAAR